MVYCLPYEPPPLLNISGIVSLCVGKVGQYLNHAYFNHKTSMCYREYVILKSFR